MKHDAVQESANAAATFSIFLVIVSCVFAFMYASSSLQPKGRLSCSSFGSYDDILAAFHQGAHNLDSDNDGIPCESRKS